MMDHFTRRQFGGLINEGFQYGFLGTINCVYRIEVRELYLPPQETLLPSTHLLRLASFGQVASWYQAHIAGSGSAF